MASTALHRFLTGPGLALKASRVLVSLIRSSRRTNGVEKVKEFAADKRKPRHDTNRAGAFCFSADFFRTGPVSSGDVESSAGGLCVGWPVAGGRARAAGLELLQLLLEGGKAVGALERMLDCSAADSEFHTCEISVVCWPTLW
jgi:hypothetical protein